MWNQRYDGGHTDKSTTARKTREVRQSHGHGDLEAATVDGILAQGECWRFARIWFVG